ncbi:unnamed protein product [Meganyctiphanes norvegica]|uniref:Uncharacterized protein n=1 Tax=Meganyctiphanes norvegica TaxID=48144 RepID=A0AAV2S725_MEGNR
MSGNPAAPNPAVPGAGVVNPAQLNGTGGKIIIAGVVVGLLVQIMLLIIAYLSFKNKTSSRQYIKEKIYGTVRRRSLQEPTTTAPHQSSPRSNHQQIPKSNPNRHNQLKNKGFTPNDEPMSRSPAPACNVPKHGVPDPIISNTPKPRSPAPERKVPKPRVPDPISNTPKPRAPDPIQQSYPQTNESDPVYI